MRSESQVKATLWMKRYFHPNPPLTERHLGDYLSEELSSWLKLLASTPNYDAKMVLTSLFSTLHFFMLFLFILPSLMGGITSHTQPS
jgi:hypothetical protein